MPYIDGVDPHAASPGLLPSPDGADLQPDALVILLRDRETSAATVTRIGRNRSWMRTREVKVAFVSSPRAPQVLARQFLPHLGWRDLAELAVNQRVSPVLRREGEKLLKTRLPELALGEKVALARRGSRGIVEMLRDETEVLVLRAVAANPRAKEEDFERILARPDIPPSFLSWLADQSSWSQRRAVRLALVRHPRTPPPSALHLIPALSRRDIDDLRSDVAAPRLVRVAAERQLAVTGTSVGAGVCGSRALWLTVLCTASYNRPSIAEIPALAG